MSRRHQYAVRLSSPRFHEPGGHTAYGGTLEYRLAKLERRGILEGAWLDLGCAEGYYTCALGERATSVVGLDPDADLIDGANRAKHPANVTFVQGQGEELPFDESVFDGVLLNEVLEHVDDEVFTLKEIKRVLRPGGVLALFSPNRWFPFEGHGARWSSTRSLSRWPVPLMPWLPTRLTDRVATARNYWPGQLGTLVTQAGLKILAQEWAIAQFEAYPWIPAGSARWYRRHIRAVEQSPFARFLAVSTFILAESVDD